MCNYVHKVVLATVSVTVALLYGRGQHLMQEDDRVTEPVGRPAYQQVADDLQQRISSGEFPVGSVIPSTAKLTGTYQVSVTVVRAAVAQLRADGLLVGQPGKGAFVRSTPEAVAEHTVTTEDLSQQVAELRVQLQRAESSIRAESAAEIAVLRQYLKVLRAHIADLYTQLGKPDPESLTTLPDVERPGYPGPGE
jgi:DNA-binding FadR family transcriptional regulator